MLAVAPLLLVIVSGVTVEPVTELSLQHKSFTLLAVAPCDVVVKGSVDGLKEDV